MTQAYRIRPVSAVSVHQLCDTLLLEEGETSVWVPNGHYWGAFDEHGNLVGFGGLVAKHPWLDSVYFHAAGVSREARGHGLQRRLIRARLAWARRNGYTYAVTDTVPSNVASAKSLIACGFRPYWPGAEAWKDPGACYWAVRFPI